MGTRGSGKKQNLEYWTVAKEPKPSTITPNSYTLPNVRTNIAFLQFGRMPNSFQDGGVPFMISMREIKPRDIHASINHGFQLRNLPTSRTNGTKDFGTTIFGITL